MYYGISEVRKLRSKFRVFELKFTVSGCLELYVLKLVALPLRLGC